MMQDQVFRGCDVAVFGQLFFLSAEMRGPLASVCCVGYMTASRIKWL
jgi:hypothetical protein